MVTSNVTISGKVRLDGDVNLILCDCATLTAYGQTGDGISAAATITDANSI